LFEIQPPWTVARTVARTCALSARYSAIAPKRMWAGMSGVIMQYVST